jgi:ubiquinone/menaquinone biosynthesis C-methylase UbiE
MNKDKTKEDFSVRAPSYGKFVRTYRDPQLFLLMVEGLIKNTLTYKVLDLACGQGDVGRVFFNMGMDVYFLDKTPPMLKKGISEGKIPENRVIIHDMNFLPLPFNNNFFDFVVSRYAFHDVEDKTSLLLEIKRVLKANGRLQIVDMCAPIKEVKDFYNYYHKWKTISEIPRECWILTKEEMYNLFEESGFRPINELWYTSKVDSMEWLKEEQISEERHQFLYKLIIEESSKNKNVKTIFNVSHSARSVNIEFPVIILSALVKE